MTQDCAGSQLVLFFAQRTHRQMVSLSTARRARGQRRQLNRKALENFQTPCGHQPSGPSASVNERILRLDNIQRRWVLRGSSDCRHGSSVVVKVFVLNDGKTSSVVNSFGL